MAAASKRTTSPRSRAVLGLGGEAQAPAASASAAAADNHQPDLRKILKGDFERSQKLDVLLREFETGREVVVVERLVVDADA